MIAAAAPLAPEALARRLEAEAYALGFDLFGIAELGPADSAAALDAWLDAGHAGEMAWLARGAEKRRDSRRPVPGATRAIVVALDYGGRQPAGPVARYARGDDYHDLLLEKLQALHRRLDELAGRAVPGKAYVDTGPLLERGSQMRSR
jgi:epoxyqueuosine reductase